MASVPNMRLTPTVRPGQADQPGDGAESEDFAQLLSALPESGAGDSVDLEVQAAPAPEDELAEAPAEAAEAILSLMAGPASDPLTVTVTPRAVADGAVTVRGAPAASAQAAMAAPAMPAEALLVGSAAPAPAGDRLVQGRMTEPATLPTATVVAVTVVANDVRAKQATEAITATPAPAVHGLKGEPPADAPVPGKGALAPTAPGRSDPAAVRIATPAAQVGAPHPVVEPGAAAKTAEALAKMPVRAPAVEAAAQTIVPPPSGESARIDPRRLARTATAASAVLRSEGAAQAATGQPAASTLSPIAPAPQPIAPAPVEMAFVRVADVPELLVERQLDMAADGEWIDQLARDIAGAGGTDGRMRFRLNPEHLGTLRVELAQGEQGTSVRLVADNEAARAMLADAQPRLLAEARAQGVRIADTHVDLAGGQAGDPRRQDAERREALVRTARDQTPGGEQDGRERPRVSSDRYA